MRGKSVTAAASSTAKAITGKVRPTASWPGSSTPSTTARAPDGEMAKKAGSSGRRPRSPWTTSWASWNQRSIPRRVSSPTFTRTKSAWAGILPYTPTTGFAIELGTSAPSTAAGAAHDRPGHLQALEHLPQGDGLEVDLHLPVADRGRPARLEEVLGVGAALDLGVVEQVEQPPVGAGEALLRPAHLVEEREGGAAGRPDHILPALLGVDVVDGPATRGVLDLGVALGGVDADGVG